MISPDSYRTLTRPTRAPAPCRSAWHFRLAAAVAALLIAGAHGHADTRPIDAQRSTLTVHVYKSGLFSAFADNHVIKAPIASGSMSEEPPLRVELTVRAADLTVSDPDLSAERRAEVQTRMLGAEVLDTARFSDITFASTAIEPAGAEQWKVTGRLTLHGQSRVITFAVVRQEGRYRGDCEIKQRDFGIQPISIAGGTVKVKDEVKIHFDLAGVGTRTP
jgi:YceI-like domain